MTYCTIQKESAEEELAAITGSQYATDDLLICPGTKLFMMQNTERETEREMEEERKRSVSQEKESEHE